MERVVVGIDSESPSATALDWVIERAGVIPMSVTLVTVQESPALGGKKAQELLRDAAARLASARPAVEIEVRLVDGISTGIADALTEQAAGADLLVVGHHRGRIVRSALAGALPMQVAARAVCPVVIIPNDWLRRFGKTIVGLEWDSASEAALEFAARETATFGRSLDIVHVEPDDGHPGDSRRVPPPDTTDARGEQLRAAMETARAGHPGLAVRTFEASGDPDRILKAHAREAAMIVVGSHGAGATEAVLHGARAYDLMNWSQAPLCVVPPGWRGATLEEESA
ncbi:MAG: universal stress protein [Pseudolysinimonas sp.]